MEKIIGGVESAIVQKYDQINRGTLTKDLVTRKRVSKTFRKDYKKRRILNESEFLDTPPWGF